MNDSSTQEHKPRGPRLYHKKSRTGCTRCKQRRVKCDEIRPSCGSCSRHAVECVYLTTSQASSVATGRSTSATRHDSRPISHATASTASSSKLASTYDVASRPSPVNSPPGLFGNDIKPVVYSPNGPGFYSSPSSSYVTPADDSSDTDISLPEGPWRRFWELRLLYNYYTNMSQPFSIPQSQEIAHMWQHEIPELATRMAVQQNRSALLYVIFANSALYLWTKSTDKQERIELMKLQQVYHIMCREQRRDIDELLLGMSKHALFVCFTSIRMVAHSIGLVQTMAVDPWEPPVQWLHMGRGSGDILNTAEGLADPEDAQRIAAFEKGPPDLSNYKELITCDHSSLDWLLEHPAGPGSNAAQEDHELDDENVRCVYGNAMSYICSVHRALADGERDFAAIRRFGRFAVYVPPEFTKFIEEKRPRAMVILAHFMALWIGFEHIWMIGKAGELQVRGIYKALPIEWSSKLDGLVASFKPPEPPKRKAATTAAAAAPKEKQSKLAKEHNISAREEREIKEAFALFAEPAEGEKEGVIPIKDVRRAMVALGLPPSKPELAEFLEILDPEDEGYASYEPFVALCALKLHARESGPAAEEVDEAFRLFTGGGNGAGADEVLTLSHLRRVAMTLKQDVDDQLLKDMILEANGGAGVGKGVGRAEFEEVMRRAGAWK
ncbi:Caltractin [Daldinia childiae]|uniref:Caltractin n=1 Tax=Daldinia childiae TaxID=326645 RepID=UPI001446F613|nr:Caltractin [Daldinia childiae]KAF3064226.1 Caltractin [Daldinia childiae]